MPADHVVVSDHSALDIVRTTPWALAHCPRPERRLRRGRRLRVRRAARGRKANGTDGFRGVHAKLGEFVGWRDRIWALTNALVHDPMSGIGDSVVPGSST
jgi:hypothetical protein